MDRALGYANSTGRDAVANWRVHGVLIAAYLATYVLLDWVSYIYPVAPPLSITPWNPQAGLSLAFLLRLGARNGAWLFVAAAGAELLVRGAHLGPLLLVVVSLLPMLVYTSLALALRRVLRFNPDFSSVHDGTVFAGATALATAVLALAVVSMFEASGLLPAGAFPRAVAQYWIGDLLGILVTVPVLLIASRGRRPHTEISMLELAAQFAAILAAIWLIFGSGLTDELKLFYVLFMPLIWIGVRHGIEGSAFATAVIQVCIIVALWLGEHRAATVLDFQFLLLAVAITGLFLGLSVSERQAAAVQLHAKQIQLDRALRLAGASEIASALAHELNQPLLAIGNYARACQLMLARPGARDPALPATMDKVAAEVARAGEVTRRLRDFFRTGSSAFAPIEVNALLREAAEGVHQRAERHRIAWRIEAEGPLPRVMVDRIQVEVVLHNLLSNAIDALKEKAAGAREIALSASAGGRRFVRIGVSDNGPGIDSGQAGELFRPFSTTKPKGMGLGLAISRSIVEGHGGELWLERAANPTRFCFTLPSEESGK